jgi:DNA-nicking Smr family endonuclease
MAERPLSSEEAALWARVLTSVRPLKVAPKPTAKSVRTEPPRSKAALPAAVKAPVVDRAPEPGLFEKLLAAGVGRGKGTKSLLGPIPNRGSTAVSKPALTAANTLDGSWDKKLARGLISPDRAIDLHGHNLSNAYATLDGALEQAIRQGDRVVLLVTGKPPRPASERPHPPQAYRGAIRASVSDWLAGSRHARAIAAVRAAHPRHGGAGALYIILRKPVAGLKS